MLAEGAGYEGHSFVVPLFRQGHFQGGVKSQSLLHRPPPHTQVSQVEAVRA